MVYQSKVESKIIINHQTGEVKLEEFKVGVGGYSNTSLLNEAKESYNSDIVSPGDYDIVDKDWPEGVWHRIYHDMLEKLKNWRNRKYKYKN